jgi:N-acetylglucosaminyldiphosphoundecaprenol N-acetyl-beta-D-mannosaminyltransferase
MATMEATLLAAAPDIVFVALGSPKQEVLIDRLRHALPRAWWLGVGISFSFVCGRVKRAPRWMQQSGLEWLYRLSQEPKRLARRYLLDGMPFACRLLAGSLLARAGLLSRSGAR